MSQLSDLLERYRRGAELLAMATTGAAGPVLDFKAEGYEWTVRQIVCHLADAEALKSSTGPAAPVVAMASSSAPRR